MKLFSWVLAALLILSTNALFPTFGEARAFLKEHPHTRATSFADGRVLDQHGVVYANKRVFWSKLMKYKRNRYLMGAGSVAADNADKELQDTGLGFGAGYTVLRVVEIEGNQLIQLRNPPGKYNKNSKKKEWRAVQSRIMESHCSYCCS